MSHAVQQASSSVITKKKISLGELRVFFEKASLGLSAQDRRGFLLNADQFISSFRRFFILARNYPNQKESRLILAPIFDLLEKIQNYPHHITDKQNFFELTLFVKQAVAEAEQASCTAIARIPHHTPELLELANNAQYLRNFLSTQLFEIYEQPVLFGLTEKNLIQIACGVSAVALVIAIYRLMTAPNKPIELPSSSSSASSSGSAISGGTQAIEGASGNLNTSTSSISSSTSGNNAIENGDLKSGQPPAKSLIQNSSTGSTLQTNGSASEKSLDATNQSQPIDYSISAIDGLSQNESGLGHGLACPYYAFFHTYMAYQHWAKKLAIPSSFNTLEYRRSFTQWTSSLEELGSFYDLQEQKVLPLFSPKVMRNGELAYAFMKKRINFYKSEQDKKDDKRADVACSLPALPERPEGEAIPLSTNNFRIFDTSQAGYADIRDLELKQLSGFRVFYETAIATDLFNRYQKHKANQLLTYREQLVGESDESYLHQFDVHCRSSLNQDFSTDDKNILLELVQIYSLYGQKSTTFVFKKAFDEGVPQFVVALEPGHWFGLILTKAADGKICVKTINSTGKKEDKNKLINQVVEDYTTKIEIPDEQIQKIRTTLFLTDKEVLLLKKPRSQRVAAPTHQECVVVPT